MLRVALTGGMAAGKSTVSAHLASLGFPVSDADHWARAVVAPGTAGLARVVAEFGPQVLTLDGSLDRAALARVVFGDPAARLRLEAIVHPLVRAAAEQNAQAAQAAGAKAMVFDIPLLVETGQADSFDLVVTVSAPEELRLQRVMRRGLDRAAAQARLAAQASDAEREAVADLVLDGSGAPEQLRMQVDQRLVPRLV
ncbi:MAG: dephospho-CoA kinase [Bifidobacteriaceae bacterium]|nr:dephospho-CoA kinase [Bifidobacteriaceae bacterium]